MSRSGCTIDENLYEESLIIANNFVTVGGVYSSNAEESSSTNRSKIMHVFLEYRQMRFSYD